MRASVSARMLEQCFPTASLGVAFCPPGKWTSVSTPPLVADPSVNACIHVSCGYLSAVIVRVRECFTAVIVRVRECFTVSSCVSPPEREGTVVWTLMSVMSITHVKWVDEKCALGQSILKLTGLLLAFDQRFQLKRKSTTCNHQTSCDTDKTCKVPVSNFQLL